MSKKKWTKEETQLLKDKYPTFTEKELLDLFQDRKWGSISGKAHQLGLRKASHYWKPEEDELLIQLYGTMSCKDMVSYFNDRNRQSIQDRCGKLGLTNTNPDLRSIVKRKYSYNRDFFKRFDNVMYYWLGFIIADGYIHNRDKCLSIALQASDRSHLEQFKKDIEYNGEVRDYDYQYDGKPFKKSVINLYGKEIIKDLSELGIENAKTHSVKMPQTDCLTKQLALLKGYIDGDGYIRHKRYFAVTGNKHVLMWIKSLTDDLVGYTRGRNLIKSRDSWQFSISGNYAETILSILKDCPTPCLQRKWNF